MSSVSEDAMFKALLKNKPEPKPQAAQKTEVQARRETTPKPGSEDAMYKALLNRPQKQPVTQVMQKPQVKESAPVAQVIAEPKIEAPVIETRVAQSVKPAETGEIVESIKTLNASVNMVYGFLKTVIVPVLVLILLIGIGLLIKAK